jgi:geranylgeranyl pyrophosphate synthase
MRAVAELVPAPSAREALPQLLGEVSAALLAEAAAAGPFADVLRYAFFRPGKQLRSRLVLGWAAGDGGPLSPHAVEAATAVELLHEASLLHDDVCDRSEWRRGRASAARAFGVRASVLAGAFVTGRAVARLGELAETAQLHVNFELLARLAQGQALEAAPPATTLREAKRRYLKVVSAKTGALFALACDLGVQLRPRPSALLRAQADRFARALGVGFQVLDDAMDLRGGPGAGKPAGGDLRAGVVTWPSLVWAQQSARPTAALLRLTRPDPDAAALREELCASGAVSRAERFARRQLGRARRGLQGLQGEGTSWLVELVEALAR